MTHAAPPPRVFLAHVHADRFAEELARYGVRSSIIYGRGVALIEVGSMNIWCVPFGRGHVLSWRPQGRTLPVVRPADDPAGVWRKFCEIRAARLPDPAPTMWDMAPVPAWA